MGVVAVSQGIRTTDATRAAIIAALQCPTQPTYQAIADRFGMSRKTVWAIAKQQGLYRRSGRKPQPSPEQLAKHGSDSLLAAQLAFYARRLAA